MQRDGVSKFSYYPRNATLDTEEIDINAPDIGLNSQILDYQYPQKFNTMKGVQDGAYASMLKTYDPIRKLEEENVYSISKVFDRKGQTFIRFSTLIRDDEELETIYEAEEMLDVTTNPDSQEAFVDKKHCFKHGKQQQCIKSIILMHFQMKQN